MKTKKFLSSITALAIAASTFAGFAVTANAAYSYDQEKGLYIWAPDSSEYSEKVSAGEYDYNGLHILTAGSNDWTFYNGGAMYGLAWWKGASSKGNRCISYTPDEPGILSVDVGTGSVYISDKNTSSENMEGVNNNSVKCEAGTTYYVISAANETWVKSMQYQVVDMPDVPTYSLPADNTNNNILISTVSKDPINIYSINVDGNTGTKTVANVDIYLQKSSSTIKLGITGRNSGKPTVNTYFVIEPGRISYITKSAGYPVNTTTVKAGKWYRMTITETNGTSDRISVVISDPDDGSVVFSDADVESRNASRMTSKFFVVESSTDTYLANVNVYNPTTTYTYKVDGEEYATSTVVTGAAPVAPETDPTKPNYKFLRWEVDSEDSTVYNAVFEEDIPVVTAPTATYKLINEFKTETGNTAEDKGSAYNLFVTPGTDTIETVTVKVNGISADKVATTKIESGSAVFAIAVNALSSEVTSITAVLNNEDYTATEKTE